MAPGSLVFRTAIPNHHSDSMVRQTSSIKLESVSAIAQVSPFFQKTLVLLDAHAIIHRAYHALPSFSNSQGEPTGALYGIVSMLIRIVEDLKPDYIVAAYDLPKPTFRHQAYDAYKGGRAKTSAADPLIVFPQGFANKPLGMLSVIRFVPSHTVNLSDSNV
jgi:hypothetical protein